jgi:hypothetical protein
VSLVLACPCATTCVYPRPDLFFCNSHVCGRASLLQVRGVKSSDTLKEASGVRQQKSIGRKRGAHKDVKQLFYGVAVESSFTKCIALGMPHVTEMLIDFLRCTSLEVRRHGAHLCSGVLLRVFFCGCVLSACLVVCIYLVVYIRVCVCLYC